MSSLPSSPIPCLAKRYFFSLGVALLGGLACVAAFVSASRSNVAALEQFEETTGFGDTLYFTESLDRRPSTPVVSLDGMPLFLAGAEKIEQRDTRMLRIGRDPVTGLTIYDQRDPMDGKESARGKPKGKPAYFLKTGPDEYIKLRPAKG